MLYRNEKTIKDLTKKINELNIELCGLDDYITDVEGMAATNRFRIEDTTEYLVSFEKDVMDKVADIDSAINHLCK